jgi:hypothetical protein
MKPAGVLLASMPNAGGFGHRLAILFGHGHLEKLNSVYGELVSRVAEGRLIARVCRSAGEKGAGPEGHAPFSICEVVSCHSCRDAW